jgi:hypothetical protein
MTLDTCRIRPVRVTSLGEYSGVTDNRNAAQRRQGVCRQRFTVGILSQRQLQAKWHRQGELYGEGEGPGAGGQVYCANLCGF